MPTLHTDPDPLPTEPIAPAVPEPQSTPAAEPQQTPDPVASLFEHARSLGIDTQQYETPQALIESLAGQARQGQAAMQFAQQQLQQHAQPQSTPQPKTEEEWNAESYLTKQWGLPAFDPQWQSMIQSGAVQKDHAGRYVPTTGNEWLAASPSLAQLNEFEFKRAERIDELFNGGKLYTNVWSVLQEPLKRMLDERLKTEFQTREQQYAEQAGKVQTQQALAEFEEANKTWLFDAKGNFTPRGQEVIERAKGLVTAGLQDRAQALQIAAQLVPAQTGQPAATPAAAPAAKQDKTASFLEQSLANASHQPSAGSGSVKHPPGQDPASLTDEELSTMFVRNFEKLKHLQPA